MGHRVRRLLQLRHYPRGLHPSQVFNGVTGSEACGAAASPQDDLDAKLAGFSAIIEATPDEDEFSAYASAYGRHLYARGIHQEE